jgi:hypothetical protein
MKHRLPWVIAHSGLNEVIDVSGYIEIDDDGLSATIHSKVYGFKRETEVFFGHTFSELESDMGTSNYPFDTLMDKVRTLRYWPRLKKRIEQEESNLKQENEKTMPARIISEEDRKHGLAALQGIEDLNNRLKAKGTYRPSSQWGERWK